MKLPYFDNADVMLDDEPDENDSMAAAALDAFLTLTPADRLRDTRHVYAYYQDFRAEVGGEDGLDEEMGVPATPEAIWDHVQPGTIGIWKGHGGDENTYVFVECNCDWEVEHGLLMVWRNGSVLNKVGGFDGHPTNAAAFDEVSLSDVVYSALDARYSTRLA